MHSKDKDVTDKTWKSLDELQKSINELDDILGRVPNPFADYKYYKKPKLTLIKGGKYEPTN